MKFKVSAAHKQQTDKAFSRAKWMATVSLMLGTGTYFAQNVQESVGNYIQFVEAQEDLLVAETPFGQESVDGSGKIATADFYAWYGLEDLEFLDQEYSEVRNLLGNDLTNLAAKPGNNCQFGKTQAKTQYSYNGQQFDCMWRQWGSNGYIEEYYSENSVCFSGLVLIPGTQLMSKTFLGVVYLFFLLYLFLGIAIIADLFMAAIETITSTTAIKEVFDKDGNSYKIETPVWNATIANLTLMALGSSAPEILLAVIETCSGLGDEAGELGPSTIVGSACFNLMVITAICIPSVDEPKAVADLGVFMTTSFFSIFAYCWLYVCLAVWTPNEVTIIEGWLTLSFFLILCVLAFGADKYNEWKINRNMTEEDKRNEKVEKEKNIKKTQLRVYAVKYLESVVVQVAQGLTNQDTASVLPEEQVEIRDLYQSYFGMTSLDDISVDELQQVLQPNSLLDRFIAKKQAGLSTNKDFLEIKGAKGMDGQMQTLGLTAAVKNELIGFKCLAYSVTESNGFVEITVVKKTSQQDFTFGIRTIEDTAKMGSEFEAFNKIIELNGKNTEETVKITIYDNNDWQPDQIFFVELYDPGENGMPRYKGDDTKCKITILDEDFPGQLCFEEPQITACKSTTTQVIALKVLRVEGSDGNISCTVSTEQVNKSGDFTMLDGVQAALPGQHYQHMTRQVAFKHNENEANINVTLIGGTVNEDENDTMFRVTISDPQPSHVKLSRKNVCFVTLTSNIEAQQAQDAQVKMIEFFMSTKKPTWTSQFKNAILLGPRINDENLIVEDVSLTEAILHFATVFWKVLFACVPPPHWGGGWPAFLIALSFIGGVTAVVGEVASLLGCVVGMEDSITAITFVALGTSLPDTFASITAAQSFPSADSAVGNVTGSNSVNVFLGLGLPWVIAAHYNANMDPPQKYVTPAGQLGFSVMIFLIASCLAFVVLAARRIIIGGELGGPKPSAYASMVFLISLWLFYITMSILRTKGVL